MNKIFLSPPNLNGRELEYVKEAFDSNWIAPCGPQLNKFEEELAKLANRKYALAVTSGTAAIHLGLIWLGVEKGDYVFCSDFTFIGSCNPILYQGATPVFIDSEVDSWNMSPIALEKAFKWAKKENKMPKAVVVVDLYGESADYSAIIEICSSYNVPLLEDSAEAVGSLYKGKPCGSFGDVSIFSFNGNKIVTTSGGGAVLTDSKEAVEKMRFWATQSKEPVLHYEHKEIGYNYRLSNISAALGCGQLEYLKEKIAKRKIVHKRYINAFEGLNVHIKEFSNKGVANGWLNSLIIDDENISSNDLVLFLQKKNIEARPIWKPMHLQPIFKENASFSHYDNEYVGDGFFERGLCLPSGDSMSEEEQNYIIDNIKEFITNYSK